MKTYDIYVHCGQFVFSANDVAEGDVWSAIRVMVFGAIRQGCNVNEEVKIRVTEKRTLTISEFFSGDGIVYEGMLS